MCDSHVISDISKHSGLQEVPRSIDTVASTEKLCSLFLSNVNIVENLFGLLLRDLRTVFDIGLERVANLFFLGKGNCSFNKTVVDTFLDEGAGARHANLP